MKMPSTTPTVEGRNNALKREELDVDGGAIITEI